MVVVAGVVARFDGGLIGVCPVVAERLPLTEARRAHEMLESSAATGKVVLVP